MQMWKQLLFSIVEDENQLATCLKQVAQELNMTLKELAHEAEIPISTLYKLSSTEADARISTIRKLVIYVKNKEQVTIEGMPVVALITSRDVLDNFGRTAEVNGVTLQIKEYLANSIEDEMILGVQAVREGVNAILCGPIAANTLKKIVEIPVIGISFSKESLMEALEKAHVKI